METNEIRYFLAAAKTENIHKASKTLHISPSAISKAITRLEEELEVKLFKKVGRNIQLTTEGLSLLKNGAEFLALEKQIVESYNKDKSNILVRIVGPELLLSCWGPSIIKKITKKYPKSRFSLDVVSNDDAIDLVKNYSADLAITGSIPLDQDKKMQKKLIEVEFKTFSTPGHSLTKIKGGVPLTKILEERFVVLEKSLLGRKTSNHSDDGWRDDKFRRSNTINVSSLKCLDSLLKEGLAISYLPSYYGEKLGLKPLKVLNCPFNCKQSIFLLRNKYSIEKVWELI